MPRSLSPAVLAAITGKVVSLGMFVRLAFADNTLYLYSGLGTITPSGPPYDPSSTFPYGSTFTGLGWLGKISSIPQTTKIQSQNVTIALSGIPSSLLNEAIGQVRITGTLTVWYGFFNSSGNLLADPVQVFLGSMDVPSVSDDGSTSTISISCENTLLSLNLAPNHTFDDPDQQLRFPGDLGFSFVQALQNIQLFWPAPSNDGTPYPVYMTVSPSSVNMAVGGSVTVEVTVHYSDGSTKTKPANTGSGPDFILDMASSNPAIAIFQYTTTNNVTGVSPGACNIMARIPGPAAGGGPATMRRQVCAVFVDF